MLRNKLIQKVQNLDIEMDQLFNELKGNSFETLNKKKDANTWSPIQILDHIILSERLSLGYCKKKLSFDPKLKTANFRTWINGRLISWSLQSPFKFKAPDVVTSDKLVAESELGLIKEKWKALRAELLAFIHNVPEKYIDKEVYKHPFGLRMSLNGMLDFYKSHFRRHRKQLRQRI
ncbi:DinB family protein [Portibacter lacus]|nr:DinB family protein [Portibacter lacus]